MDGGRDGRREGGRDGRREGGRDGRREGGRREGGKEQSLTTHNRQQVARSGLEAVVKMTRQYQVRRLRLEALTLKRMRLTSQWRSASLGTGPGL